MTILVAAIVFGDRLNSLNASGLVITLCGIGFYNYLKYRSMVDESPDDRHEDDRSHTRMPDYAPEAVPTHEPEDSRFVVFDRPASLDANDGALASPPSGAAAQHGDTAR